MSGRPALIRQREAKQIIEAAKKAGAKDVEIRIGEVALIVHLFASGRQPEGTAAGQNPWDEVLDAENKKRTS